MYSELVKESKMRNPNGLKNLNSLLRDFKDIKLKKIAKIDESTKFFVTFVT